MGNAKYRKNVFDFKEECLISSTIKINTCSFLLNFFSEYINYLQSILLENKIIERTKGTFKMYFNFVLISRNFRKILFQMASLPLTIILWHIRGIKNIHFKFLSAMN